MVTSLGVSPMTASLLAGDPVGGGAAQRAARAELRRAEYHRDDPGPVSRAMHWIGRQLSKLFEGGAGATHAIVLVVVVLLVIGVFFAVRAGAARRVVRAQTTIRPDLLSTATARDHQRLAEQFTADGRFAEALREWLRAAVATIDERGVLPPRPGRTGAATAREAGPLLPDAADDLSAAMHAFDEVWFGGRTAQEADVRRARAAADSVAAARIRTVGDPRMQVPAVPR